MMRYLTPGPHGLPRVRDERAFVLIACYLMISVLTVLQLSYLSRITTEFRAADRGAQSIKALHYADAGLDEALVQLSVNRNYSGTGGPITLGAGSYAIAVAKHPTQADAFIADITGAYPDLGVDPAAPTKRVQALLYVPHKLFAMALFSDERMRFDESLWLEGYDSRNGPYSITNSGMDADIATNGEDPNDIYVDGMHAAYTTAFCGVGTNPIGDCVRIDGVEDYQGSDNLTDPLTMPTLTPPVPPYGPSDFAASGTQTVILNAAHPLVFQAPGAPAGHYTMVVDNFDVTGRAVVRAGAEVTRLNVYVRNNVQISGRVTVGDTVGQNAERFLMFATHINAESSTANVILNGLGTLYGAVIAPDLQITIDGFHVQGGLSARRIEADGILAMRFDRRLLELTENNESSPSILTWRND